MKSNIDVQNSHVWKGDTCFKCSNHHFWYLLLDFGGVFSEILSHLVKSLYVELETGEIPNLESDNTLRFHVARFWSRVFRIWASQDLGLFCGVFGEDFTVGHFLKNHEKQGETRGAPRWRRGNSRALLKKKTIGIPRIIWSKPFIFGVNCRKVDPAEVCCPRTWMTSQPTPPYPTLTYPAHKWRFNSRPY